MKHDCASIDFLWLRSVAVSEQLLPLELASGTVEFEDQLHPTKASMDTIGMALDQVAISHKTQN
jgi:hypothetical protein